MGGHVGEPVQDPPHTLRVVLLRLVRDPVVIHNLCTAELRVAGVHLPTQQLVQCSCSWNIVQSEQLVQGSCSRDIVQSKQIVQSSCSWNKVQSEQLVQGSCSWNIVYLQLIKIIFYHSCCFWNIKFLPGVPC